LTTYGIKEFNMAAEYISELGDKLGNGNTAESLPKHIKVLSAPNYRRVDNGVVTNPSIQEAIDGLSSPKVKNQKTIIRHTITAADVTNQSAQFEDPIVMPSGYGSRTIAFVNLTGTITTDDTSGVTNAYMIALDFNSAHSFGTNTYSVNFVVQPDVQVNFESNTQVQLSGGTMHPDGLYLEIYRHGLPVGSTIAVTAEVTVLDRE
jgi:hypothetical protein